MRGAWRGGRRSPLTNQIYMTAHMYTWTSFPIHVLRSELNSLLPVTSAMLSPRAVRQATRLCFHTPPYPSAFNRRTYSKFVSSSDAKTVLMWSSLCLVVVVSPRVVYANYWLTPLADTPQ